MASSPGPESLCPLKHDFSLNSHKPGPWNSAYRIPESLDFFFFKALNSSTFLPQSFKDLQSIRSG
jgi:hypothetical protein